jgi:hypothetical protein
MNASAIELPRALSRERWWRSGRSAQWAAGSWRSGRPFTCWMCRIISLGGAFIVLRGLGLDATGMMSPPEGAERPIWRGTGRPQARAPAAP